MRIVLIIFLGLSGLGSIAQKKLIKQAAAYEESGMYELAAEKYMEALYRDMTRTESIQGLKRSAQKVVDKMLSDYFIARNSGDLEAAITQFEWVKYYKEKLDYFSVSVEIPSYYFNDYEADKTLLKKQKEEEQDALVADELKEKYDAGVNAFNGERWVEAWNRFSEVAGIRATYEQTAYYLDEIRSRATTLAIIPNKRNQFSAEEKLRTWIIAEISLLDNPMIRMINRENLDQIIEEQKLGLSGVIDERSAAALGQILGAKMIMLTRVVNHNFIEGSHTEAVGTAFTVTQKPVYDPATQTTNNITEYYPATYKEYRQKNVLQVSIQYQLIDTQTAEVHRADILQEELTDDLTYRTFDGNYLGLYPSNGTAIYTKGKERDAFLELFKVTRRTPLTKEEMEFEIQRWLAKKVALSIDNYFRK